MISRISESYFFLNIWNYFQLLFKCNHSVTWENPINIQGKRANNFYLGKWNLSYRMFQHFYWHFWITRRGVFIILFPMPCWHQQQLFNLQTIQIAFANFLRSTILLVLDKNFNILNFMTRIQVRIHSKLEKWKLWNTHIEKM